jgi:tetratricopeptide (TPR) repeat protein
MKDYRDKTHRVTDYAQLLAQNVDAVTAATRAFGDLKQLQSVLEGYVRQGTFQYLRMPGATDVDDAAFQVRALATPQADAVRADFLAYNQRTADARALLDRILQENPNNVLAHETMGFLEFQERHIDEARNWYAQAVKLDSQSYLAHYYFAAISMNGPLDAPEEAQVESSLRASIKLNPSFAPSYDRLAALLAMHHRNLDEAHMMALNAVNLEPRNMTYRMETANVLLQMERGKDAVAVIRNAMQLATSPQETAMAEDFLRHAEEYAQAQEQNQRLTDQLKAGTPAGGAAGHAVEEAIAVDSAAHDEALPNGPHHFVTGVLKDVRCNTPAIDLNLIAAGKTLGLHSGNYFKIEYSALGLVLKGNLNPCADLEGRPAKVEYVDSSSKDPAAVVAIEIHK